MTRFRNILAVYNGTNGSEAVLDQSIAVARGQNARLTLLKQLASGDSPDEAQKRLRRIVPWIVQQGVVKVETAVTADRSYQDVLRRISENAHDLVLIGSEAGSGLRNVIFGNLGKALMRQCPCPVWVMRPEQPASCARILAAVGDDDGKPTSRAMNSYIVGLGTALAQTHGAELHIMHAWTPAADDAAILTNEISDETREGILRRNEAQHRNAINRLLSRMPVATLDHQIHLPRGLPQTEIVTLAGRLDADVVVMGSTWRTGAPRLLLGNPAETVYGTVGSSVLTVNPAGLGAAPVFDEKDEKAPRRLLAVGAD